MKNKNFGWLVVVLMVAACNSDDTGNLGSELVGPSGGNLIEEPAPGVPIKGGFLRFTNSGEQEIPAGTSLVSEIDAQGLSRRISEVRVNAYIRGGSEDTLVVTLTSPNGTSVTLAPAKSEFVLVPKASLLSGTRWTENAYEADMDDCIENSLLQMAGENANGAWTLEIANNGEKSVDLTSWNVDIKAIAGFVIGPVAILDPPLCKSK